MGAMIVRHSVRDYGVWRPVFDAHDAARTAAGLTNGRVFRSAEDPNDLLLLFEMADRRRAEEGIAKLSREWSRWIERRDGLLVHAAMRTYVSSRQTRKALSRARRY